MTENAGDGQVPEHTSLELAAIHGLTEAIHGLRVDVQRERRGRRLSIFLMGLAIVVGSIVFLSYRDAQADARRSDCELRIEARRDIRESIIEAVDTVAIYADLTPQQEVEVHDLVEEAVVRRLPPPDC